MKKIISLLLCLSFAISLTSCDKLPLDKLFDKEEEEEEILATYYKELDLYNKYLEEKILYDQKKAEYDKYLADYAQYSDDLKEYNQYLTDKQIYEQNKEKYDLYIWNINNYYGDLEEYQEYLENYQNYLVKLENYQQIKDDNDRKEAEYNAALEKYNSYLDNMAIIEKQIANLDAALFTKLTYLDRQLYASLFSPLVDEVVGRKEDLVAVRPKLETHINNCAIAITAIQTIFKPDNGVAYDELRTTEEKYEFYVNNYYVLCTNVRLLGESLYKIYTTSGIRALMHEAPAILGRPDYTEKLSIFIGQLLCLSDALHDEPLTYTDGNGAAKKLSEMTFSYWNQAGTEIKKVSVATMLESNTYVVDTNNATPISITKVDKPIKPDFEELPTEPEKVEEPIEPTPISHPGEAPEEVTKPKEPEKVENPGNPPEEVKKPTHPKGFLD